MGWGWWWRPGGACGPPRAASRALTQCLPAARAAPGNRCVSRHGELGALLRRRPRCRDLSRLRLSRRRPAPGPAPEPQAAPPTPGGQGAGRTRPGPRLRGVVSGRASRGAAGPHVSPALCARPPDAQPEAGSSRGPTPAPLRLGLLGGVWEGRGALGGRRGRWYSPPPGCPPPPSSAVQVSAAGGRGLRQSQGYRTLLKCRYGCGEGRG